MQEEESVIADEGQSRPTGSRRARSADPTTALPGQVRRLRQARGWTLDTLASASDVSRSMLSQIELGKNSASIETLYRISLGLGVKMAELFENVQAH